MTDAPVFEVNPRIDRAALAARFATDGRVQVRDVLTDRTARGLLDILRGQTPWGVAWGAPGEGPHAVRAEALAQMAPTDQQAIGQKVDAAMRGRDYAFLYAQYPMLDAYLQRWRPDSAQDRLLEHINDRPFLDLAREITGIPELIKADAQATLYAPGHFLAEHNDSHVGQGWRIAYVLSLCAEDWRPDWGGYLLFYDEEGDVIAGYRPRFNALNLFAVPQRHAVTYVPPFAPVARFALTGWFRDR